MAQDPYRYFRVEARELLDQLGKGVLDVEKGQTSPELTARLLRLAHTLKGAARVVRQTEIADLAHSVEDALAPLREPSGLVPAADAVLALLDDIGARLGALAPPAPAAEAGRPAPEEPVSTVRAEVAEMDALLDGLAEAHAQVAAVRRTHKGAERARELAELLAGRLRGRTTPGLAAGAEVRAMAGDLIEAVARIDRGLAVLADQLDRELRSVRDTAERLRLVPAGTVFTSLERAARDTGQTLGRRVAFEGRGGDIRLDAHVLGLLQSALVQLVRNAVAHGIEPEADRRAAGKPPDGRVVVAVARIGRQVSFTCADDGRGIDLAAVRQALQREGRLPPGTPDRPEELLRSLLSAGISTSQAITAVAGRGVGLDVVREAVAQVRGRTEVRTTAGAGTQIEIRVPLSLASIPALRVEASGVEAALPLEAVRHTLRVAAGDVTRGPHGQSLVHEREEVPFLPLRQALARAAGPAEGTRAWSAVIVQGGAGRAAVGVDRLLGTTALVLRPLPEHVPPVPVVAGACLDAEGNPLLVLDPDGLVSEARRAPGPEPDETSVPRPVLVIDDSLTTRMLEQSILESAGYQVELASSAEEALDKALARAYGLFLVDIEMPGMDGFTFVERTRGDPRLRDVPSILVSSRDSAEDRQRGTRVGAKGYMAKGEFDQGELLRRIRELMG